jgi:signal transduction histidine kinase
MPTNRDECPRLLALAVHEFRTPVTVVAGYVRMFLKMHGSRLDEPSRKMLDETEKSCARLSALIGELSDLANFEAGHLSLERREVDLFPLVAEVAASVHEGADRDIRLAVSGPREPAIIDGDRPRLSQALSTLFTATIRERAEPGVMATRWGVEAADGRRTAWIAIAPGDAETPSDGFRAADWGPFEQWRGGLGFRLVMAREVIVAHGGALYSGHGSASRASCALTFPVKESSC